jgi:hypothetical protein
MIKKTSKKNQQTARRSAHASKKWQICPLFPERKCPQGTLASNACQVRINGDFDPMAYFKDLLVMHCAIYAEKHAEKIKIGVR